MEKVIEFILLKKVQFSLYYYVVCGGDKDSQQKDIRQAKQYWLDYQSTQANDKD